MNSLASLTHAAAPAAPAFNADFYITAATVIPVLFLAFAVQGRTYQDMLQAIRRAKERAAISYRPLRILALLILAAGTNGEIVAILALYDRSTSAEGYVLIAVISLVIAVVVGPAYALWRTDIDPKAETVKTCQLPLFW